MATAITVVCPHCNNRMRASSDYIGRQGRCPSCKALVEIVDSAADHPIASADGGGQRTAKSPRAGGSTDVPGWLVGLTGGVLTVLLYMVLFYPLAGTRFGATFVNRGIIPYITMLFSCLGFSILGLKYWGVLRQMSYAELELELIPLEIGLQVTPANVDQFIGHLTRLPPAQRYSILGRRLHGALEHFKSRNSVPEVQTYLTTQAEIDASAVDGGYTMLKALIWAVPMLGFIGTVVGLSAAVSGLETVTQGGDIAAHLKVALGGVTAGLATAFDTTLIALVMAVLLLFPMEALRRTEYRMLDRIEQFANESLLRRMAETQAHTSHEELPDVVRSALEGAFKEHERWLAQWQAQVSQLGQLIGGDFESAAVRVHESIAQSDSLRLRELHDLKQGLSELFNQAGQSTQSWHDAERTANETSQEFLDGARRLESVLAEHCRLLGKLVVHQNEELTPSERRDQTAVLQRQIENLLNVLNTRPVLAAESSPLMQAALEPADPKPRDGFFQRIFRDRN